MSEQMIPYEPKQSETDRIPDYPAVKRDSKLLLIHTRKQAEAGRIIAPGKRVPHYGKCNELDKPHRLQLL